MARMETNPPKIDVHHHMIPPELVGVTAGLKNMKAPIWTVDIDKDFSESVGVRTSILSVSTPGVTHIKDPEESAKVARSMNEHCASLRDKYPTRYGFFATVPSLEHTELVLQELKYAFDVLHADGVTLFTSYATPEGYLGHNEYVPVWKDLNSRKAVVFVHPINNKNAVYFDERLPEPAFNWPHETAKTAMDLILKRRMFEFPDVKIILSHGGGTLAALVKRSTMIALPEFFSVISAEDITEQAKRFYFDLAISGSDEMLPLITGFAKKGHLLFGSDFPHCPAVLSQEVTKYIDDYPMDENSRREIYYGTGLKLFPRLKEQYSL